MLDYCPLDCCCASVFPSKDSFPPLLHFAPLFSFSVSCLQMSATVQPIFLKPEKWLKTADFLHFKFWKIQWKRKKVCAFMCNCCPTSREIAFIQMPFFILKRIPNHSSFDPEITWRCTPAFQKYLPQKIRMLSTIKNI